MGVFGHNETQIRYTSSFLSGCFIWKLHKNPFLVVGLVINPNPPLKPFFVSPVKQIPKEKPQPLKLKTPNLTLSPLSVKPRSPLSASHVHLPASPASLSSSELDEHRDEPFSFAGVACHPALVSLLCSCCYHEWSVIVAAAATVVLCLCSRLMWPCSATFSHFCAVVVAASCLISGAISP